MLPENRGEIDVSNPSNLIVPTSEQASENGRKGGIASGEARRAKKNMKQMAKMLMEMPVVGETNKQNLKNFGVQSEDQNYNTAIVVRLMQKALLEGDTGAIRLLGELTGDFGGAVGAGDDTDRKRHTSELQSPS